MQMQMETCDLNECDFLETKFTEYENLETYMEDGEFIQSRDTQLKGVIMYFANTAGNPVYKYMPLTIQTFDQFTEWETELMDNVGLTWISNYYWKLDIISCVLVPRNKQWFQSNIHDLETIWNTILEERTTDYSHRAPNKRPQKTKENNDIVEDQGCLIKL